MENIKETNFIADANVSNIPIEKFLSSIYILDCDVKKNLKIKDNEIATIVGLASASEINTEAVNAFIEENKKEKERILNDLLYLTATSTVEFKM
jgi:hypothetical protein